MAFSLFLSGPRVSFYFQKHFWLSAFISCKILSWYLEINRTSPASTSRKPGCLKMIFFWQCVCVKLLITCIRFCSIYQHKRCIFSKFFSQAEEHFFIPTNLCCFNRMELAMWLLGLVELLILPFSVSVKVCLKQSIQLCFINHCVTELISCN